MRRTMTRSEALALAVLKRLGVKVKAQVVIGQFYIADFIGADRPFVLEIGGPTHIGREDYDARRDALFTAAGFTVIRVRNENVSEDTLRPLLTIATVTRREINQRISYAKTLTKYSPEQWAALNGWAN